MLRPVGRWLIIGAAASCLLGVSSRCARVGASAPNETNPPEQNLAIIVNTSNPVDSLSMSELRHVFLG